MAAFFLIDHSLKDSSGHHFDYVTNVAGAAVELGFETWIGTNRKFPPDLIDGESGLGKLGRVLPVFRDTTYRAESSLAGLRQATRSKSGPAGRYLWARRLSRRKAARKAWAQERIARRFADDCSRFFQHAQLSPGDHVFFGTVSELEFLGLSRYLEKNPETIPVHWHLQYHFNVFDGRPPEYEKQSETLKSVRSIFQKAFSRLPGHSIRHYTTSLELQRQYQQLGMGNFEELPYPVAKEFVQQKEGPLPSGPVRISCPGGIRREKGHVLYLQQLVDQIGKTRLGSGDAKLVVQRPKRKFWRREKLDLVMPKSEVSAKAAEPIEYLSHPLSRQQYIDLIRSTGIGLLFYDRDAYYSRRAGVLGELLTSGKPVIVPAGCWLAEQIQQSVFEHADDVLVSQAISRVEWNEFQWRSENVPMLGGILAFDQQRHPFEFDVAVDAGQSFAGLCFQWHCPTEPGIYCRIDFREYDCHGSLIGRQSQIVGHRKTGDPAALFAVNAESSRVSFCLSNAFHHSTASIKSVRLETGKYRDSCGKLCAPPIGKVGVIAADQSSIPDCVEEILRHLAHYRKTAMEFSEPWYANHDPLETVKRLTETGLQDAKAA